MFFNYYLKEYYDYLLTFLYIEIYTIIMENSRLLWVDWIKFLAIFGVIGIHVSSSLLNSKILFSLEWYQGVFASSLFRFGIILFIMASGYLILRRQQSIYEIPKRIKRVFLPFIFWLVVYAVIKVIVLKELGPSWNIIDLFVFMFKGLLDPTIVSIQFWYVYMIIGLYILSPLLSRWIQNAPINEIEYALGIWIIVSCLQFVYIDSILIDYLRYFTGAIGYFILGYYLTIKRDAWFQDRTFGLMLFLIGTLITFLGTVSFSILMGDQSLFFIRLGDITPGACLQGVGLFIFVYNSNFDMLNEKINNVVVELSKTSYGIYLCNILVIKFFEKIHLINLNGFTLVMIFLSIILVLIVSTIGIEVMDRIPVLKLFSGKS